jgi:hypothetical protein
MKCGRKTFKVILTVLFVGVVISVSSWAVAQEGCILGSVKDLSDNQGIAGVIIKVKDVSTSALVGTGTTDALGNYLVNIPSLGNYILLASKLGYGNVTTQDVIELSDMTPNWTVDISMGGKVWLMKKPDRTDSHHLVEIASRVYTLLDNTRFIAAGGQD